MKVTLKGHEIHPYVYGGKLSRAISGVDSKGYFRYDLYTGAAVKEYFTEADDVAYSYLYYPEYEALGFTADGNSRLILRVTPPVSGSVRTTRVLYLMLSQRLLM